MIRSLLVAIGCVAVSLCIMLLGQHVGDILFPVTSDAPIAPVYMPTNSTEIPPTILFRLHVPFWAPVVHVAACIAAAVVGGFLAARLSPRVLWPLWIVGSVLAGWELFAIAEIPKRFSSSVVTAAACIAFVWLGAALAQIGRRGV